MSLASASRITSASGITSGAVDDCYISPMLRVVLGLLKGAVVGGALGFGGAQAGRRRGRRGVRDLRAHRRRWSACSAASRRGARTRSGRRRSRGSSGSASGSGSTGWPASCSGGMHVVASRQPGRAARSLDRRAPAPARPAGRRDLGHASSSSTTAAARARRPPRTSRATSRSPEAATRSERARPLRSRRRRRRARAAPLRRAAARRRPRPRLCARFSWRCSTNRRRMMQHGLGEAEHDVGGDQHQEDQRLRHAVHHDDDPRSRR